MLTLINTLVDELVDPAVNGIARALAHKYFWYATLGLTGFLLICWWISGDPAGVFFGWDNVKTLWGWGPKAFHGVESLVEKITS